MTQWKMSALKEDQRHELDNILKKAKQWTNPEIAEILVREGDLLDTEDIKTTNIEMSRAKAVITCLRENCDMAKVQRRRGDGFWTWLACGDIGRYAIDQLEQELVDPEPTPSPSEQDI
jgi:hypothetical protein